MQFFLKLLNVLLLLLLIGNSELKTYVSCDFRECSFNCTLITNN